MKMFQLLNHGSTKFISKYVLKILPRATYIFVCSALLHRKR